MLIDAVVIAVAYVLAWMIRFIGPFSYSAVRALAFEQYMFALIFIIPGYLLLYQAFTLYEPLHLQGRRLVLANIVKANVLGLLLVVFSLYMIGEPDFSRLTVYIFCVVNIFMEWGVRLLIYSILKDMRKRGLNQKQILLVGYSRAAEEYIDRIKENPQWGYIVRGILDDNVPAGTLYNGVKVIGRIANLTVILPANRLDEIAITLGLSEYYRATTDKEALEYAVLLFESIEEHSFDRFKNGYCEALTCQWGEIEDMRLSEKDANERKTMNTHLHILEPYTNLYRVWKDERLRHQLRNLITLFTDKILDRKTFHLRLFFDDDWNSKYPIVSYGHDIEASWLLHEAALELGEADILAKVEPIIRRIAIAAGEGFTPERGMIYEKNLVTGHLDADRHWWVQAETVVGYMNIYQYFEDKEALQKATACWEFKSRLIDRENGEWYWSIRADDTVNRTDDKAGFWKCPYHNGRMCLEVMERFGDE